MLAVGQIGSLGEGRDLVRRSFPVESYEPKGNGAWAEAYQRFIQLLE
jgi:rhamnulokinase